MNVTFLINGQDFAPVLSTYRVVHRPEYSKVIRTINGEEHVVGLKYRTYIVFSTFPVPEHTTADERALNIFPLSVKYTDPGRGIGEQEFRIESDFSQDYGIHNLHGINIYRRGEITLKALRCDDA